MKEKEVGRPDSLDARGTSVSLPDPSARSQQEVSHDRGAGSEPLDNRSQSPSLVRDPVAKEPRGKVLLHDAIEPLEMPGAAIPLALEVRDRCQVIAGASARERRNTAYRAVLVRGTGTPDRSRRECASDAMGERSVFRCPLANGFRGSGEVVETAHVPARSGVQRLPRLRAPRRRTPPCRREDQAAAAEAVPPMRRVLPSARRDEAAAVPPRLRACPASTALRPPLGKNATARSTFRARRAALCEENDGRRTEAPLPRDRDE